MPHVDLKFSITIPVYVTDVCDIEGEGGHLRLTHSPAEKDILSDSDTPLYSKALDRHW